MRLARLTWPQAERVLQSDPVVILPVGTAEQHGRHLPLGTDMLAPEAVCDRIEQRDPDVLILPGWSYGQCDSQTEFPGTISLGPQLLYEVVMKIFTGLMRHGVRRFIALIHTESVSNPSGHASGRPHRADGAGVESSGSHAGRAELVALRVGPELRLAGRPRRGTGDRRDPGHQPRLGGSKRLRAREDAGRRRRAACLRVGLRAV